MKLIGFNYNKINVEKLSGAITKDLKVNTNIDILSLDPVDNTLLKVEEKLISAKFEYSINYDPNVAKIEFQGNMIISLDSQKADELMEKWKDKKILDDVKVFLFNIILRKSNIKALQFEDEFNLPLHMPIPRVTSQGKKDN